MLQSLPSLHSQQLIVDEFPIDGVSEPNGLWMYGADSDMTISLTWEARQNTMDHN